MPRGKPFKKGQRPGPGRPPGTPNKFTSLRESFLETFISIGGTAGLISWARKNRTRYYELLARLLPRSLEGGLRLDVHRAVTENDLTDAELEKIARRCLTKEDGTADSGKGEGPTP